MSSLDFEILMMEGFDLGKARRIQDALRQNPTLLDQVKVSLKGQDAMRAFYEKGIAPTLGTILKEGVEGKDYILALQFEGLIDTAKRTKLLDENDIYSAHHPDKALNGYMGEY